MSNTSTPPTQNMPIAGVSFELSNLIRAAPAEGETLPPPITVDMVFSAGAPVMRYDWINDRYYREVLVVDPSAIRLDRLKRGAPFLNSHSMWSLDSTLGIVDTPTISGGVASCRGTFSRRESVAGIVQDVQDGILRSVSVGYARHKVEMIAPTKTGDAWEYRVVDWEPLEVSIVAIPADMDAQIKRSLSAPDAPDIDPAVKSLMQRTYPCTFVEIRASPDAPSHPQPDPIHSSVQQRNEPIMPKDNTPNNTPATTTDVDKNELHRAADIAQLCARHGCPELAPDAIRNGLSVDAVRAQILDKIATRDQSTGGQRNVNVIQTISDEMDTKMHGITQAIMHRCDPAAKLDDNGRQYRGLTLIEMGRDFLSAHHIDTRGMARLDIATRMMQFRSGGGHGTSDFPSLLANVANNRLRNAYDNNPGTYDLWARRAPNAPDFKQIQVSSLSGTPELLPVNEHGEYTYGSMADGKEVYAVVNYGRIVSLTRQAIVNDDLRGFDRLLTSFGASARRLENSVVYAQLTNNAAMSDGTALFHADHGNLITSSALALDKLGNGRAAMRKQTGLNGELLNIAPAFLIVPVELEQTAYQLTSANYVPATTANVNEFRAGGRTAVSPIVEPLLSANSATAWYLAANSGWCDTVEYCWLDGAEGPRIESEMGFEVDGISFKCSDDFAAKAIDHRGLLKATA